MLALGQATGVTFGAPSKTLRPWLPERRNFSGMDCPALAEFSRRSTVGLSTGLKKPVKL